MSTHGLTYAAARDAHHHVACQQLLTLEDDPDAQNVSMDGRHMSRPYVRRSKGGEAKLETIAHGREGKHTYMIRPTGNTAPPRNLTRPGFDSLSPGDPPDTISERRPPNESITPAATYAIRWLSISRLRRGRSHSGTHRLEENEVGSCPLFRHTTFDHSDRDLDWLERAWGIETCHRCSEVLGAAVGRAAKH